jgi:hypothetical protein
MTLGNGSLKKSVVGIRREQGSAFLSGLGLSNIWAARFKFERYDIIFTDVGRSINLRRKGADRVFIRTIAFIRGIAELVLAEKRTGTPGLASRSAKELVMYEQK